MNTLQVNTEPKNGLSLPIINNTALVVEGGGQRGIFTAGILDSWLAANFNPFSLLIGTSAGAQNLSTYMTRQPGHARKSIMELSKHPEFFSMKRTFSGSHSLDLDWYFQQTCSPQYRLNIDYALSQLKGRQLLFSATDIDGFHPAFFEPTEDNWLTMLKASSAIPYLYKRGVEINDKHYIDGGVVLPIPVQEAYYRGARKIVVLRTTHSKLNIRSPWAHKLKSWVCKSKKQNCPKVLDIITEHENAYNDSLDFIRNPPEDAEVGENFLKSEAAQLFKVPSSEYLDVQKNVAA